MIMRTTNRKGITLTEVLVALFVMALGMLALLTLFPLGAMQIGQALKDDRTEQAALEADGFMRTYWEHEVVQKWDNGNGNPDPFVWAMDVANASQTMKPTTPITRTSDPSFPVLIDPLSFYMTGRMSPEWVAGPTNMLLPRRNLEFIRNLPTLNQQQDSAFQHFSMTDDIWFEENGVPNADPAVGLRRQGRYNWAIMLQRPDNTKPLNADMKILVFDGRLPNIAPLNEEVVVSVNTVAGQRQLQIDMPARTADEAPLLRIGGWLMDGTLTDVATRRADFYRITGLTEDELVPNRFYLDLDQRFKFSGTPAQIYFFVGLAEVFDRPQLRPTTRN